MEGEVKENFAEACLEKDLETIEKMVKNGADITQIDRVFGRNGLLRAAEKGKKDIIRFLHSKNDQLIHSEDDDGKTVFDHAASDKPELLQFLKNLAGIQ